MAKGKVDALVDGETAPPPDSHGSTLFVSNLSYSTTSEGLQAAFDDLAPVRSCFVVYEKPEDGQSLPPGQHGQSKGVGYVTFAVKEDAETVASQYNVDAEGGAKPLVIDGRRVRVKWADRKPTTTAPAESFEQTPAPPKKPRREPRVSRVPTVHDPDAIRTLVIANLATEGMSNNVLWKKIRKYDGAESVVWPANDDPTLAFAIFSTPAKASAALPKLHSHLYKGTVLSVVLKKRVDTLVKPDAANPASGKTSKGPHRGGRLIVRNLPWNITEADLRALFTPYGPIHSVNIPTVPLPPPASSDAEPSSSKPKKPLARGFAFVWFLSKQDAEKAIVKANGAKIYAGFAKDKAMAAAHKIAGRKEIQGKMRAVVDEDSKEGEVEEGGEGDGEGGEEGVVKKATAVARVIAVDWAVSKERWQEMNKDDEEGEGGEAGGLSDGEESVLKIYDGDDGEEQSEQESGSENEDSSAAEDDDEDVEMEDGEKEGPPPPEEGTTLFVRNVPFEATEDDLKALFRAFGPLRYARITMDYELGRSRGTGFVCFWKLEDADACVEEADRMRADLDPELNSKKNPFTLLTLDPSSSRAARLVLQGRTLDVTRAVSRDKAEKLRQTGERARERKDTRNLYLMREGVIFPSTPAAANLSPSELERRQQAFQARRTLLKSNPSLYISNTRLSIRQLPTFVTERVLKRLAMHAIRAFEDEVKAGTRAPLAADELEGAEEGNNPDEPKKKKKSKQAQRSTGVKQAKIVRQADRIDVLTGKGRSKGYGFLELERHEDALRVIRWANNNRAAPGLMWEWWNEEVKDLLERGKKELKDNGASLKAEEKEGKELRVKKLAIKVEEMANAKEKNQEDGSTKDGRTLLIEFSIENVQVVKRRHGKEEDVRSGKPAEKTAGRPNKKRPLESTDDNEDGDAPSPKKAKKITNPSNSSGPKKQQAADPSKPPKLGNTVGGIIGKKRRERKGKGK